MTAEERSDRLLALAERIAVALETIAGKPLKQSLGKEAPFSNPEGVIPNCPECGVSTLLKTAKGTGNQFWGCPNFPTCRITVPL